MTARPGTTAPPARVLAVVLGSLLLGGAVTLLVAQGLRVSWAAVADPGRPGRRTACCCVPPQ